jgi:hypothetical protein
MCLGVYVICAWTAWTRGGLMLCDHHSKVHKRYLFQCVAVLFQATHLLSPPPPRPGTRKPHSFLGVLKRSEHNVCVVIQCHRAAVRRLEIDASPMSIFAVVIQIG